MKLVASYKRRREVYDGSISMVEGGSEPCSTLDFQGFHFRNVVVEIHKLLVKWPEDTELVFQRTDRPGLAPVLLDRATTMLIREDPVAAAKAMSPAPVVVRLKDEQAAMGTPMKKLLRAGHDTLAAAFGDVVYCVMQRGGGVECPICGRWGRASNDRSLNGYFRCKNCGADIIGKAYPQTDGGWWGIDIRVLLQERRTKYYLPREWNTTGPWISRVDLQKKYDEYLKEKERCLENLETH